MLLIASASESAIVVDAHHVEHRHAFGDRDDDFAAGVDRFEDRVGGERGGDEDHRGVGAFLFDGFVHRVEHGHAERGLAALARRDAGDELRAVLEAILGMKLARLAGDALANDAGVFIDQDAHDFEPASLSSRQVP